MEKSLKIGMESLEFLLERIAIKIRKTEEIRKRIGEKIRRMNLIRQINPLELELTVAGIDGGVERKSLRSFDLLLLKSIGVVYYYKKSKLSKVEYYPEALPKPEVIIFSKAFSETELDIFVNIQRQKREVETATEVIKKFKPDVLLLDGSVIPHYSYVQSEDSPLYEAYERMIEAYKRLFYTSKDYGCLLAGVIKDSRGSRFSELIASNFLGEEKEVLEESKDISILDYSLKKCERTIEFDYTDKPEKHPILKEFKEFRIKSFYFKPSEFDTPVRVDMLEDDAEKVAGLLCRLIPSESYAVPAVLIEADQRARITKEETMKYYTDIVSKVGPINALKEMRRDKRPF